MSLLFQALQDLGSERETTPSPAPGEAIEFLRCAERKATSKSEAAPKQPTDGDLRAEPEPRPRRAAWAQAAGALSEPSEPSTALAEAAEPGHALRAGVKRIAAVLRMVLPFVERTLPLLEGITGATDASLAAPATSPEPQTSDVAHIVENIAEFKAEHLELRVQVVEQNASLKRAESGLGMVREATERNTREQQELIEDLRGVGNKVTFLALVALGLLGVTLFINIALYLRILNIRP